MRFSSMVIDSIRRSEDVLSIRFEKPFEFSYTPGQFMFLTINPESEALVKHFTISSSPSEDFLEITKKLTGHTYSDALLGLEIGDQVAIEGPRGDFTYVGEPEKVLFLTGGIGITPIRSIVRYCIDLGVMADMVLLYSCRDESNILFKDELDDMASIHDNLRVFYTVTRPTENWLDLKGRINAAMIRELVPDFASRDLYICGPLNMVDSLNEILENELDLSSAQIHKEKFPGL